MQESELKKGDIIFFNNIYKTDVPYHYIDHVALFAGFNEQGLPTIIHNISSKKGHYHPEKASGLCVTTLRALTNQLQKEDDFDDVRYDVEFLVFRNKKDPAITELALKILLNQSRYKIPYDDQRLNIKIVQEDNGMTGPDFKKQGEENYRTLGIRHSQLFMV